MSHNPFLPIATSTPSTNCWTSEFLWFDDGSKIYLQLSKFLFAHLHETNVSDGYLFVDFYTPPFVWISMLCWTKWWLWSSPCLNSSTIAANYDDALLVIDGASPTIEFCFNVQCFEIDGIELENVIKGGHKVNKHVDLWAKNAFDEWRKFWRYDIKIYSRFV